MNFELESLTGLGPVLAIALGYPALVAALAVAAQPMRRGMFALAESMLAEPDWRKDERDEINQLMDTCMSFRVGALLALAAIGVMTDCLLGRPVRSDRAADRLWNDRRFHRLVGRYLVSVLAANPIVAVVSLPLLGVSRLVVSICDREDGRIGIDEPVVRAANGVANPCSI
jgi:hypothetical protein